MLQMFKHSIEARKERDGGNVQMMKIVMFGN